jgi:hypothetical protein
MNASMMPARESATPVRSLMLTANRSNAAICLRKRTTVIVRWRASSFAGSGIRILRVLLVERDVFDHFSLDDLLALKPGSPEGRRIGAVDDGLETGRMVVSP